ncbi:hypothetical protein Patl1_24111 [Pistacia atlantica]|uniref:Uncharacterized protein n=1 Tax=Pistacia atlantica TaxID=434234 RepID=A0ACC1A0I1_9ROSI|nr:hypothetical protein Patl1_24111 [Pistacia atlantica]
MLFRFNKDIAPDLLVGISKPLCKDGVDYYWMSLWKYGLEYRQGIGHGIGSYLNIQEDPSASADLAVVLMQDGLAHILLIAALDIMDQFKLLPFGGTFTYGFSWTKLFGLDDLLLVQSGGSRPPWPCGPSPAVCSVGWAVEAA